jgi:hypothetical protein
LLKSLNFHVGLYVPTKITIRKNANLHLYLNLKIGQKSLYVQNSRLQVILRPKNMGAAVAQRKMSKDPGFAPLLRSFKKTTQMPDPYVCNYVISMAKCMTSHNPTQDND